MKITRVRIFPFTTPTSRIRAYAEVELESVLTIRGIRILESKSGGLFLGFPSQRTGDGQYRDYVILSNREFEKGFREAILDAYRNYKMMPDVNEKELENESDTDGS